MTTIELSVDKDFTDFLKRCQDSSIRVSWEREPTPASWARRRDYDDETNRLREVASRGMTYTKGRVL